MGLFQEIIQHTIESRFRCESTFKESINVEVKNNREIVWKGNVEVFDLSGHPEARRAYGWSYIDSDYNVKYAAILGKSEVDCPVSAVQKGIAQGHGYPPLGNAD